MPHARVREGELGDELSRGISALLLMEMGGVSWVLQPHQPVLGWDFQFTGSRVL